MKNRERCAWALSGLLVTTIVLGGGYKATNYQNGDVNGDGTIDISDAVYLLQYLFESGSDPVTIRGLIPATGQTECYGFTQASGWEVAACDDPSVTPGQDGDLQNGAPIAGRFIDNGDGTVTDQVTGLMWVSDMASPGNWEACLEYCQDLDTGGHSDWRMPNINELLSVAVLGRPWPPFNVVGSGLALTWYHPDFFSNPFNLGATQRIYSSTTGTGQNTAQLQTIEKVYCAELGQSGDQGIEATPRIYEVSKSSTGGERAVWAVRGPVD